MLWLTNEKLSLLLLISIPLLSVILWWFKADTDFVWLLVALSFIATGLFLRADKINCDD
jgi:hypothetical protein